MSDEEHVVGLSPRDVRALTGRLAKALYPDVRPEALDIVLGAEDIEAIAQERARIFRAIEEREMLDAAQKKPGRVVVTHDCKMQGAVTDAAPGRAAPLG